jgi:hypothetical protein
MVRKNLDGGGCGCGSSGLLGFPQNGGGCGCSGAGVLPQMGGKGFYGRKSQIKQANPSSTVMATPINSGMSQMKEVKPNSSSNMGVESASAVSYGSSNSMPKKGMAKSQMKEVKPNSSSNMGVESASAVSYGSSNSMPKKGMAKSQRMSATKIMHSNGRSLDAHMENIHGQLDNIQAQKKNQSMNYASSSSGLFGGGIFDFLSPKKPVEPLQTSRTNQHVATLPHNQPPTLQEVVRDLQFRVKTLEDEVRPATIHGGYKATKKNLNALKKYKQGKSIGFTMRSSLKAKGLIPRANGTRRVSKKYRG